MTNKAKEIEDEIRQRFIGDFTGIVKGNSTPGEMADYVLKYVMDKSGLVNIDYQDVLTTLENMKEGDCLVVETEKANLQSALRDCETKLKNAHPGMNIEKLMLQIITPQQSGLTMNDMQMFYDFFSSIREDLEVSWGIAQRDDDSDRIILFIVAGFNH